VIVSLNASCQRQHIVQLLHVQHGGHGGPGGQFRVHQAGRIAEGPLEGLGSIPYKIRIHANDDVYEVTRNRMTEAEDKYKNKCTREIKPNQTDIGRKVKVKQTRPPVLPIRRETTPSMRPSMQASPYQSNSIPSSKPPQPPPPPVLSSTPNGLLSNGLGSNHVSSSRPQLNNREALGAGHRKAAPQPSKPYLSFRERLIQLLALRPFKKIELLDRLTKEGLRERNSVTSVLKQVSNINDNCYILKRPLWNEVHEDWPFYSESEKQILKRRKPQNLTPPGSSDGGSSGSGQSPTSTHPGSPPPPIATSAKRPGFHDGPDGFPYKRQRIAHGTSGGGAAFGSKQSPLLPDHAPPYRPPIENNSQRRPMTDSRDASNMNPRSRESPTSGYYSSMNGYANGGVAPLIDDDKRPCDSHNSLNFGIGREKTFLSNGNSRSSSPAGKMLLPEEARKDVLSERQNGLPDRQNGFPERQNGLNGVAYSKIKIADERDKERDRDRQSAKYNKVSSSTQNRISRVSPDSQTDGISAVVDLEPPPVKAVSETDDFPDYKQRRYKTDFNADYAEYRDLHGIVEKVSRRFALLEERLKQEDENSPRYRDIKKQIVREYQENKKDLDHHKAKLRFQYLHDKLSHIKRLVLEYDQRMTDGQY
ncbi:hypothetical protein NQ317_009450, partial [Molorchus minor]